MLFSPDPGGPSVFAGSDKIVHVALFALLAGTARWRFEAARAVLPAVLAYAALSEIVQWLALAERSGDVLDLLADTAGALVGWYFAGRRLTRRP